MNTVPQTALESLIEARRLIAEKGWVKHDYAVDADGDWIPADDPRAARFCMLGALERADGPAKLEATRFVKASLPSGWDGSIAHFNDAFWRTRGSVLKVFDKAIEKAREAQQAT